MAPELVAGGSYGGLIREKPHCALAPEASHRVRYVRSHWHTDVSDSDCVGKVDSVEGEHYVVGLYDLAMFVPGVQLSGPHHAKGREAVHDLLLRGVSQVKAVDDPLTRVFGSVRRHRDGHTDLLFLAVFADSVPELGCSQGPLCIHLSFKLDFQPAISQFVAP